MDHKKTAEQVCSFFPGLKPEDLPDGEGWAIEKIELITHNGTHLDAPYHFATTMNRGERAITIDEVPLDWCFRPDVKLDFRHFEDGYVATAADVEAELNRIGHKIEPYDIVVVNTRAGSAFGHDDYVVAGCGMGREATLYLLKQNVHVTGTDAWSWDAPYSIERYHILNSGNSGDTILLIIARCQTTSILFLNGNEGWFRICCRKSTQTIKILNFKNQGKKER